MDQHAKSKRINLALALAAHACFAAAIFANLSYLLALVKFIVFVPVMGIILFLIVVTFGIVFLSEDVSAWMARMVAHWTEVFLMDFSLLWLRAALPCALGVVLAIVCLCRVIIACRRKRSASPPRL